MGHVFCVRWLMNMCQAKDIWLVISQDWASIIGSILSPFKWVFIDDDKAILAVEYQCIMVVFTLSSLSAQVRAIYVNRIKGSCPK